MINEAGANTAYNYELGYSVKKVPNRLLDILSTLVTDSLDLKQNILTYKRSDFEELVSLLNSASKDSRESRTIESSQSQSLSETIIDELACIMPKPSRLHNNDIYFRVVMRDTRSSISIAHRDEYFHKITPGWEFAVNESPIKVWIPLFAETPYALGVIPCSHLDYAAGDATYFMRDEKKHFSSPHESTDLTPIKVDVGRCLIFPSQLVHGSLPASMVDRLRISVEITPVLK